MYALLIPRQIKPDHKEHFIEVAAGSHEMMPDAENCIDATGKYVLSGDIDCHV